MVKVVSKCNKEKHIELKIKELVINHSRIEVKILVRAEQKSERISTYTKL